VILARLLKAKESGKNYDKSSLRILWATILLSIFFGIFIIFTGIGHLSLPYIYLYSTGIAIILLGLLIRWIAILTLKKSFTVNVSVSENQHVVKNGLYKIIRHPSYTGSLLSFLGLAIAFNNWVTMVIIFFPILFAFLYRIKVEEAVLIEAFGDEYKEYINISKKLMPVIY